MVAYLIMLPVLFSIGKVTVSSFGVFLSLSFLLGIFLIWRLARAWDLNEEEILDLILLTFLGGLIGSRLYFVFEHLPLFSDILNIVLVNKAPGFSFWGAFLGGWLTLYFLARKLKQDFWLLADIASVGFLGGLILSDLGCFLGGCDVGVESNFLLSVSMVGTLGKRFPVQILEALLFLLALVRIWSTAVHFHPRGKILSLTLIYIGVIKFFMEPLKFQRDEGLILSAVLVVLGVTVYFKAAKKSFPQEVKKLYKYSLEFLANPLIRKLTFDRVKKYWYNQVTQIWWKYRNFKKILRRINVRFSFKNH